FSRVTGLPSGAGCTVGIGSNRACASVRSSSSLIGAASCARAGTANSRTAALTAYASFDFMVLSIVAVRVVATIANPADARIAIDHAGPAEVVAGRAAPPVPHVAVPGKL